MSKTLKQTFEPAYRTVPHIQDSGVIVEIPMRDLKTLGINFNELVDAYTNYRLLTRSPANQNVIRQFFKFLGLPEDLNGHDLNTKVSSKAAEQARQRVGWMSGPHAHIMYKAYQARKSHG